MGLKSPKVDVYDGIILLLGWEKKWKEKFFKEVRWGQGWRVVQSELPWTGWD